MNATMSGEEKPSRKRQTTSDEEHEDEEEIRGGSGDQDGDLEDVNMVEEIGESNLPQAPTEGDLAFSSKRLSFTSVADRHREAASVAQAPPPAKRQRRVSEVSVDIDGCEEAAKLAQFGECLEKMFRTLQANTHRSRVVVATASPTP